MITNDDHNHYDGPSAEKLTDDHTEIIASDETNANVEDYAETIPRFSSVEVGKELNISPSMVGYWYKSFGDILPDAIRDTSSSSSYRSGKLLFSSRDIEILRTVLTWKDQGLSPADIKDSIRASLKNGTTYSFQQRNQMAELLKKEEVQLLLKEFLKLDAEEKEARQNALATSISTQLAERLDRIQDGIVDENKRLLSKFEGYEELLKENFQIQSDLKVLEHDRENLTLQNEDLISKNEDLTDKNLALQNEIEELKKQLEESNSKKGIFSFLFKG